MLDSAEPGIARQDLVGGLAADVEPKFAAGAFLAQFVQHVIELRDEEPELVRPRQMDVGTSRPRDALSGRAQLAIGSETSRLIISAVQGRTRRRRCRRKRRTRPGPFPAGRCEAQEKSEPIDRCPGNRPEQAAPAQRERPPPE